MQVCFIHVSILHTCMCNILYLLFNIYTCVYEFMVTDALYYGISWCKNCSAPLMLCWELITLSEELILKPVYKMRFPVGCHLDRHKTS